MNPQWSGEYFEFRNVAATDSFTFRVLDSDVPSTGNSQGDRDRKTQYTALGRFAQQARQKVSNATTRVTRFDFIILFYFLKRFFDRFYYYFYKKV